ncbi:protein ripply2 [Elephas maximus indicus]|uniref:protein ripply2 n=1 Tax=Elephas maximus indicus TaxID=99487 RepID=UPI0021167B7B|nr:protein ripply2 [Elephas maximus indicus]
MDIAQSSESGAGEWARCRRLLPEASSDQTRRGGADSGSAGFWRPWVDPRGEKEEEAPQQATEAVPDSPGMTGASGKLSQYRHPVRLFWPKSKCYDYLYQEAEALLKNFPIQATISFYEDSDSEDEIGELTWDSEN